MNNSKLTTGYTLIETMIAISIFLIVVVIGVGSLLNAHLINKKSQDMRSIIDSLSFTMEDMSRNIRTGYNYKCLVTGNNYTQDSLSTPESGSNCFGIAFEYSEGNPEDRGDQWVYYVQDGKLFKSTEGLNNPVQMTPDEVVISKNTYSFSIIGAEPFSDGDNQQPLAVIRLVGKITSRSGDTSFSLQTTVSQRRSDI
jgi:prepilin-type N-terminal cleavage/methylation domain-containing protein